MDGFSIEVGAENFREVVLEGSRQVPVVIDFWAPWCGPCRALKPVLEKLAAEYGGRFILAKINSDENQDIAASFGVRSIPAVKAVVDGKLVDEFVGALPEGKVREFIERVLPGKADIERRRAEELLQAGEPSTALDLLRPLLDEDPRNDAVRIAMVECLIALGRIDEAKMVFARFSETGTDDARIRELRARLEFSGGTDTSASALEARIANNPADLGARLELARLLVQRQSYETALDQLLEIVRTDRKFGDDAGRRTMIEVFNLLGGQGDLVSRYRRLLSASMY